MPFQSQSVTDFVESRFGDLSIAELLAFVYQMQGRLAEKARKNRERAARKGGLVLSNAAGNNL